MKSAHVLGSAIVAAVLVASPAFARGGRGGGGHGSGHSSGRSSGHSGGSAHSRGGGGEYHGGGGHFYRGVRFHGGHYYRPYFVGGVFFGDSCWDCGYPAYWYSGDYPYYSYPYDDVEGPPLRPPVEISPEAARDREDVDDSLPAGRHDFGMLSLAVRPRDAAVYIDGKLNSTAFREDLGLSAGVHHIEVVRPGYQPFGRDITIEPNKTAEIDIHLSAI